MADSSKSKSKSTPKAKPITATSPLSDAERVEASGLINRELSWLEFDARVLAMVEDATVPLLERVQFLSIFSSNMDEFFRVRVAGLLDRKATGRENRTPDGLTTRQTLKAVSERVRELQSRADDLFTDVLVPELAEAGISIVTWEDLDTDAARHLTEVFDRKVFPVLTPLAVDPGHPFPYLSDLSLNLAVQVRDPNTEVLRFARVKVPGVLPAFISVGEERRFIALDRVIAAHVGRLFHGMEVVEHHSFRITRNADLTVDAADADDLLEAVEHEIRQRRFGSAVRLDIDHGMSDAIRDMLISELDLVEEDVYTRTAPLHLAGLDRVAEIDLPEHEFPRWKTVMPARLANHQEDDELDLFSVLRSGELLVHHPYESFGGTVEAFLLKAAADPAVLAIKLTLYRTSGDSAIVHALIRAAEAGKQVAVVIEVKARFDEEANIDWARRMEKAGVHVIYGLVGLKVHTKLALVVRREGDSFRRYCHVGTGNYNPRTARFYEDIGLLSADETLAEDLGQLFNSLTGLGRQMPAERLIVGPSQLRASLASLIQGEIAAGPGKGHIEAKMNALTDPEVIEWFYEASAAGVEVDLIVRGTCCLRPGVPGLSEQIRVRSVIGRYLEHSRIYRFANGRGPGAPITYIGSADLMQRNLDRRVESLVELVDQTSLRRIDDIFSILTRDGQRIWELIDDEWSLLGEPDDPNPQQALRSEIYQRRKDR